MGDLGDPRGGTHPPLCSNDVASVVDGIAFGLGRAKIQNLPSLPVPVAAVANAFAARRLQLASTCQVAKLLIAHLRAEPSAVALLFFTKAVRCWYATDSHRHERWTLIIQLAYLPLFTAGACLAWRSGRLHKNFILLAIAMTLYYWGMTTIVSLAIVRYMLPVTSLLMILAANALDVLWEAFEWRLVWMKRAVPARQLS